jgi:hypothetical protein
MVNNSTNINKTNETVNSDGQPFHQYQQNHLSPQIIEYKIKRPRRMTFEIQLQFSFADKTNVFSSNLVYNIRITFTMYVTKDKIFRQSTAYR